LDHRLQKLRTIDSVKAVSQDRLKLQISLPQSQLVDTRCDAVMT